MNKKFFYWNPKILTDKDCVCASFCKNSALSQPHSWAILSTQVSSKSAILPFGTLKINSIITMLNYEKCHLKISCSLKFLLLWFPKSYQTLLIEKEITLLWHSLLPYRHLKKLRHKDLLIRSNFEVRFPVSSPFGGPGMGQPPVRIQCILSLPWMKIMSATSTTLWTSNLIFQISRQAGILWDCVWDSKSCKCWGTQYPLMTLIWYIVPSMFDTTWIQSGSIRKKLRNYIAFLIFFPS